MKPALTLTPHPAAALFPMLSDIELDALAADIKANGQAVPIAVLCQETIIDGRNRYEACKRAGVEPITKEMMSQFASDEEVIRFIISTNVHRRHLTPSQCSLIGGELANLMHGGDRKGDQPANLQLDRKAVTREEAARLMGVSERSVNAAKQVIRDAPDLVEKVRSGELKVSRAATIARERIKPQTDPNQAADSVIDASEKRAAEGDTARGHAVVAAMARLDPTELTFHRPAFLRILGVEQ